MNVIRNLICLFFIILLVSSEMYIKKDASPSIIHENFTEILKELKINVTFSQMAGTLFYYIDINRNQLIVSLIKDHGEKIKVESKGEHRVYSLSELCGSNKSLYQQLLMGFEANGRVSVKCNGQNVKSFVTNDKGHPTAGFPPLKKENKAELWLVNLPPNEDRQQISEQISGCIHDVWYNDKPLFLNTELPKCKKICTKDICNQGICHETYENAPFCDCTDTFLNGPYCINEGQSVKNNTMESVNQVFEFKLLKLAWSSYSTLLLNLSNSNNILQVYTENKNLYVKYVHSSREKQTTRTLVTNKYDNMSNSILIFNFRPRSINLTYKSENDHNVTREFYTPVDLSTESFNLMQLLNNNGHIDVFYKTNDLEYRWSPVGVKKLQPRSESSNNEVKYKSGQRARSRFKYKFKLIDPVSLPLSQKVSQSSGDSKSKALIKENERFTGEPPWKIAVTTLLTIILVVMVIITVVCWFKQRKRNEKPNSGRNDEDDISLVNDTGQQKSDNTTNPAEATNSKLIIA